MSADWDSKGRAQPDGEKPFQKRHSMVLKRRKKRKSTSLDGPHCTAEVNPIARGQESAEDTMRKKEHARKTKARTPKNG